MSIIEAIILGIVQGLTEFLPVSSSGHLELGKAILGAVPDPEANMRFTVVLHAATALSTIVVFRKDILQLLKGLFQFKWNDETKFSLMIVVSMIPAAVVGVTLNDWLDQFFAGRVQFVGFMLLLTAVLLMAADKAKATNKDVTFGSAFIIGLAQAIAILPGISRSGATISTSVLLGIDKEKSARFSFLMVVPLILGKMAKDILDGALTQPGVDGVALTAGFIGAFVAGLFACQWMIKLVKKSKLMYFSIYCAIVGVIAIVVG